jgi:hypothetical protein
MRNIYPPPGLIWPFFAPFSVAQPEISVTDTTEVFGCRPNGGNCRTWLAAGTRLRRWQLIDGSEGGYGSRPCLRA